MADQKQFKGTVNFEGKLNLSDGGTVTQGGGAKTTAVTLNALTGQITMDDASLGSGAAVSFDLNNSKIGAQDVVVVHHGSAGTATAYLCYVSNIAAGSCKITVTNQSGGPLGEAIVLHFAVIGGSAS